MKLPIRTVAVVAFAAVALCTNLEASSESGIFGLDETTQKYRLLLSATVYAGFSDHAVVSFAEMPAFGPERGFWLFPDKRDCLVVWSEATKNMWYWAGLTAPEGEESLARTRTAAELAGLARQRSLVKWYEKRIPLELGLRIQKVWHGVLLSRPQPPYRIGLDGVTFVYGAATKDGARVFWRVWSPMEGEDAYDLAELAHAIRKVVVTGDDAELKTLLTRMESAGKKQAVRSPRP